MNLCILHIVSSIYYIPILGILRDQKKLIGIFSHVTSWISRYQEKRKWDIFSLFPLVKVFLAIFVSFHCTQTFSIIIVTTSIYSAGTYWEFGVCAEISSYHLSTSAQCCKSMFSSSSTFLRNIITSL